MNSFDLTPIQRNFFQNLGTVELAKRLIGKIFVVHATLNESKTEKLKDSLAKKFTGIPRIERNLEIAQLCSVLYPQNKLGRYSSLKGALSGIIIEAEAYTQDDEASHSYNGRKTPSCLTMYYPAGHLYVYISYGMHFCMNITAEPKGRGAAVLLRGLMPLSGLETMIENRFLFQVSRGQKAKWPRHLQEILSSKFEKRLTVTKRRALSHWLSVGPGKLSQSLGINLSENGLALGSDISLYHSGLKNIEILATKRIGLTRGQEKLWRFICSHEQKKKFEGHFFQFKD